MGFNVEAARAEGYSDAEIAQYLLDMNDADRENASDAEVISTLAPISAAPVLEKTQLPSNKEGVSSPLGTGVIFGAAPALVQGAGALKQGMFGDKASASAPTPPPATAPVSEMAPEAVQGSGARNWNLAETGVAAPGTQMNKEGLETNNRLASIVQPGGPLAGGEVTPGGIAISPQDAEALRKAREEAKAKLIADEAKLGNRMKVGASNAAKKIPGVVGNIPGSAKIGLGGYNAQDAWNNIQQGNKARAVVSSAGTLGSLASLLSKNPKTRAIGAGLSLIAPGINRVTDYFSPPEGEHKAEGGAVNHYAPGGVIKLAEEYGKPALKKLSEVLGDIGAEGKNLATTQSDRTIVGKGQKGGPGFPGLQHTDPEHAAANAVWGVGKPEPATMMVNANKRDPAGGLIWTNYIGSPNQHVSNPMILDEMMGAFNDAVKQGKLTPELYKKINSRLSSDVTGNLFDKSVDILDPAFLKSADTFEKRRLVGDVLGGEGVGKTKGTIIPYDEILSHYTDPAFIGQPTGVIGNRLFTLDNTITHNPDIHEGFPYILGGKDLNVQFAPVPANTGMRDFVAGKLKQKAEKGVKPVMGTYDWIRGTPIQPVTEDYLTFLQKEGHAKGGKIDDAKKFQLSTGAIEDLLAGNITPSQFPAAAKHDLTHFPKTDKASVNDMAKELAMNYGPMGAGHIAGMGLGTIKNTGGQWLDHAINPDNFMDRYGNKDLSDWFKSTVRKYVANRMGSPEDEVKKLMDKGISHMDPKKIDQNVSGIHSLDLARMGDQRVRAGFPKEGTATTPLGRSWETLSDSAIDSTPASNASYDDIEANPWLEKLDPTTLVHDVNINHNYMADDLGFSNMADALRADMASGKLRPDQLNKVSIEDAVKRAHQQRLDKDLFQDQIKKSIPKVKEYPSGYAWHDLTHEDPATLDAILKQEGETMQNCIGGYCSDVLEDGTKLYSLRDPAGNPHANVEVIRNRDGSPMIRQIKGKQNEAPIADYIPYVQDFINNPVGNQAYSVVGDLGNTGLLEASRIKQHGLTPNFPGLNSELERIYPAEKGIAGSSVFSGQHGVRIPTYDMLKNATENLEGAYITPEQLLEHLRAQPARPVEHGYSKYYENQDVSNMAGGGKVGAVESLIETAPKLYQGVKDLILPPAENAARTQIIGTLPTYQKAGNMLKELGGQGKTLDFGAGLGEGAKVLNADTFEPFAKDWTPTFTNASDIPSDAYGQLTNLNVLNVMPREMRDQAVSDIGRVMDKGGLGILTTRGKDVMKAQGRPGPEPTSIITSRDTYQKGFSPQELEDYLKYVLGSKFDINKVNLGPAGAVIRKKADGGKITKSPQELINQMDPSILQDILQRTRVYGGGGSGPGGMGGQAIFTQPLDENNALQFALSGHVAPEDSAVDEIRANFIHNF